MLNRILMAISALMVVSQIAITDARADNWFDFGFLFPHRSHTYRADPNYMPSDQQQGFYGGNGAAPFDESYYDPTLDPSKPAPKPVKHKPLKHKASKVAPPDTAAAPSQPQQTIGDVQPPKSASAPSAEATATASATKAAPIGSGSVSCDKAQKLVQGYGFADVKPAVCTGKVFAFNAMRDGKPYAIKVDAATGELTEVKKTQ
jgi:hypothetical protein